MRSLGWKSLLFVFLISGFAGWAIDWIPDDQWPPSAPPELVEGEEPVIPPLAWEDSLDKALVRAQKDTKPVLIEFFMTWQQWCRVFDEKTLSDPDIVNLSRKFVCVRVDAKEASDLVRKYGVKSYPTVVFLNPRGETIHRIIGYVAARPFEREMKEIAAGREPEKELRKLEESNPREFRPLVMLGVAYLKRQEWDKAIGAYERALEVGPGPESKESQEVIYSLCQLYDFRKKPEKAEPLLVDLLRAESSNKTKVHDMLGHVYLSLKRPAEAIEQFRAERSLVQDQKQREFLDRLIEHIQKPGNK